MASPQSLIDRLGRSTEYDDVLFGSGREAAEIRAAAAKKRHHREGQIDNLIDPLSRAKVMYQGQLIKAAEQVCCANEGCQIPFKSATPHGRCSPRYDHIVPISAGGSISDSTNLQLLCHRCNHKKGSAVPNTYQWILYDTAMTLEQHPCSTDEGCQCLPDKARPITPPWPLCEVCGECPVWTHDKKRKTCSVCHRQTAMRCEGSDCGGRGIKPKAWWSQCRMCFAVSRARERIDNLMAASLGLVFGDF